eukprot:1158533-Pelagomonas_calceolata.AAC.15
MLCSSNLSTSPHLSAPEKGRMMGEDHFEPSILRQTPWHGAPPSRAYCCCCCCCCCCWGGALLPPGKGVGGGSRAWLISSRQRGMMVTWEERRWRVGPGLLPVSITRSCVPDREAHRQQGKK